MRCDSLLAYIWLRRTRQVEEAPATEEKAERWAKISALRPASGWKGANLNV
jgi:hypothetical protein